MDELWYSAKYLVESYPMWSAFRLSKELQSTVQAHAKEKVEPDVVLECIEEARYLFGPTAAIGKNTLSSAAC